MEVTQQLYDESQQHATVSKRLFEEFDVGMKPLEASFIEFIDK